MTRILAALSLLLLVAFLATRRREEPRAIPRWAWDEDWDDPAMDVYDTWEPKP